MESKKIFTKVIITISTSFIRTGRITWMGHIIHIQVTNLHRILDGKSEGKRLLGRQR
jgi:hypothetical protein